MGMSLNKEQDRRKPNERKVRRLENALKDCNGRIRDLQKARKKK